MRIWVALVRLKKVSEPTEKGAEVGLEKSVQTTFSDRLVTCSVIHYYRPMMDQRSLWLYYELF